MARPTLRPETTPNPSLAEADFKAEPFRILASSSPNAPHGSATRAQNGLRQRPRADQNPSFAKSDSETGIVEKHKPKKCRQFSTVAVLYGGGAYILISKPPPSETKTSVAKGGG